MAFGDLLYRFNVFGRFRRTTTTFGFIGFSSKLTIGSIIVDFIGSGSTACGCSTSGVFAFLPEHGLQ